MDRSKKRIKQISFVCPVHGGEYQGSCPACEIERLEQHKATETTPEKEISWGERQPNNWDSVFAVTLGAIIGRATGDLERNEVGIKLLTERAIFTTNLVCEIINNLVCEIINKRNEDAKNRG